MNDTNNERPTPRTDVCKRWGDLQGYEIVPASEMGKIERELAEVREQRDRLEEAVRELLNHKPREDWECWTISERIAWEEVEEALAAVKGGQQ